MHRIPHMESRKRVITIKPDRREKKRQEAAGAKNYRMSRLYQELSSYQEQGVELWLNGRRSTSYQIASSVCERSNYMRDYYMDHQNHICGIGFDRIRNDRPQTARTPLCKKLKVF